MNVVITDCAEDKVSDNSISEQGSITEITSDTVVACRTNEPVNTFPIAQLGELILVKTFLFYPSLLTPIL